MGIVYILYNIYINIISLNLRQKYDNLVNSFFNKKFEYL